MRLDGRKSDEKRKVTIIPDFVSTAAGSCLIETGGTRVICTASVDESLPPWRRGSGLGWVTAEYAMLPASTTTRKRRDGAQKDGRSVEIQRLIGRSIRQAVDMRALGERVITLDCDVLEADGGTRTASITGAMVALTLAVDKLIAQGKLPASPIRHQIAAISVGIVQDVPSLDLCYQEDSRAEVDMNVVMNEKGEFIELQGTGEGRAFTPDELSTLISYAGKGIRELMEAQREALGERARHLCAKPWLVVASGNAHKISDLKAMFAAHYTVLGQREVGFDGDVE
ncbi:MAG: ribonuclease PH, partial [Clostridia bacterium]|nr:ribonuclease PH [Clostridia bacterium]